MMKKILLFLILTATVAVSYPQTNFITSGKIEFERKTNVHRLYFTNEEMSAWDENFKKLIPQFKTDYFDLFFTESKSLYKPGRGSDEVKNNFFFIPPAFENTVYKDMSHEMAVSQKQVFESQFLISDSVRKMKWKLENETRTIAGFECRKAITRICDSVVVVAFYTEEIVPSTGPESFNGLPGMILGLAVPRLYTTWFATKIELPDNAFEKKILPPAKGKKANEKELFTKIDNGLKDWDVKYRGMSLWFSSL